MKDENVDALAEGVEDGLSGAHAMDGRADYSAGVLTVHISANYTTADYYHDRLWLDINGFQTWKFYRNTVDLALRQYAARPVKPGINHEPAYQLDQSHSDGETKIGFHIRLQTYWSLLSGAQGVINGYTGIWNYRTGSYMRDGGPSFEQAMNFDGRRQMRHVRDLFNRWPHAGLIPDPALVSEGRGKTEDLTYVAAARDGEGGFALFYVPDGHAFRVDLARLGWPPARGHWFNPRTGESTPFSPQGDRFDPPEAGERIDWVLALEAPSR